MLRPAIFSSGPMWEEYIWFVVTHFVLILRILTCFVNSANSFTELMILELLFVTGLKFVMENVFYQITNTVQTTNSANAIDCGICLKTNVNNAETCLKLKKLH